MGLALPVLSLYVIGFGILLLIIAIFYGIFKWVSEDPSRIPKPPPPRPITPKPLKSQRDELLILLDQLKKRLAEGHLSEETYLQLRKEYQDQIDEINRQLENS